VRSQADYTIFVDRVADWRVRASVRGLGGDMLSGPLFVIGSFEKSVASGVDCNCVSCTLFCVDSAEGIFVG
jgi:hypothetical protein